MTDNNGFEMPIFKLLDGQGELLSPYKFLTEILGFQAHTGKVYLDLHGRLKIDPGYRWDFATGAIDTPAMVRASLAHDAMYDLIRAGKLPPEMRKRADKYFVELLKEGGVGWLRRMYVYWAVRIGYPIRQIFASGEGAEDE